MKTKDSRGQQGQVIVLGALMMTAVVGFLALVVDVGNAYAQRRFMQNAADAAAVAGARYMALNRNGALTDAAVMGAMTPFLNANGGATLGAANGPTNGAWYVKLDGTTVSPVGNGGGVPSSASGVLVNAQKLVPTYFAGVIGFPNITVKATGAAAYGAPSSISLDWNITGTPVMPLAFGLDAYRNLLERCGGFGGPIFFDQPVDWASECVVDRDAHFGFTTLNIDNDCSNQTTKTVLDSIVNNPDSLRGYSVAIGNSILVCSGSRDTTWSYIMQIGRPFIVPIIDQGDAAGCNSNCNARIVQWAYMRADTLDGNGSHTRIAGSWVDPTTQPPLRGLSLSSSSSSSGPVTYALFR